MSLWVVEQRDGGPVAIRIAHGRDRPRRAIIDEAERDDIREEWRCTGCGAWFEHRAVTWVETGRLVGAVPEVLAFCASCLPTPRA